jgi:pimeloyl-ACP methyl ester carboxylesterase
MSATPRIAAEPRRVEVADGVRLHASIWQPTVEAGAPFLLVHGLASNALLWTGVAEHLASEGHAVVAVDQRSHGRSDPSDDLSAGTLTADLVAVSRALGLERPIVVGQSWGGNVVLELAHAHPDAVRGVAALDGGTIDLAASFPSWEACWEALAPPPWDGRLRFGELAELIAGARGSHADWPEAGRRAQLANLAVRADGSATAILTRERHRTILRGMWERPPSALYAGITVPVLLLPVATGDATWAQGKEAAITVAEQALPRSRTVWFHDRDHDVHAQAPDEVAAVLLGAVRDGMFGDPSDGLGDDTEIQV